MTQHVIITGGSGFIGSHLVDAFLSKGWAVTAIDNFVTGQKKNLDQAFQQKLFKFVEADVSEPLDISNFENVKQFGVQGVFHFACPASPIDFDKIPDVILKVDSIGTFQTLEWCEKYKARYLLASTSEVYGDPLVHPQVETYFGNVNSIGPRACYDEAKRFAEAVVSSRQRAGRVNAGIVRIFNTYGPRMRLGDGRVVPELCRRILAGEALSIHGDGKQTRSFCFVDDLVAGTIRLFESSEQKPVNIGDPTESTILEFAETLQKIAGSTLPLTFFPHREDDPMQRCPDITRATQILGWKPTVPLNEGLARTLQYFRS